MGLVPTILDNHLLGRILPLLEVLLERMAIILAHRLPPLPRLTFKSSFVPERALRLVEGEVARYVFVQDVLGVQ